MALPALLAADEEEAHQIRWDPEKLEKTVKYEAVLEKERKETSNRLHFKVKLNVHPMDGTDPRTLTVDYEFELTKAVLICSVVDSIKEVTQKHSDFVRRRRGTGIWEKPPKTKPKKQILRHLPKCMFEPSFTLDLRLGRFGEVTFSKGPERFEETFLPAPFRGIFPAYIEILLLELRLWGVPLEMGKPYEKTFKIKNREVKATLLATLKSSKIKLDYTWEEQWENPVYRAKGLDEEQLAETVGFKNVVKGKAYFDPKRSLFQQVEEKIESFYTGKKDYADREGFSGMGTYECSVSIKLK
jgi:hypothetical protein